MPSSTKFLPRAVRSPKARSAARWTGSGTNTDAMNALVINESMYHTTRAVAETIAEGMGGALVRSVRDATEVDADLLVVGGPTHMHGLATSNSRKMAAQAVKEDGHGELEPGATDDPGLRH